MKKALSVLLAALTASALMVPALAENSINLGSNAETVTATIAAVVDKTPTLDGKISEGEYQEIKYSKEDLMYLGYNDARLAEMEKRDVKLYAAYSSDTVYIGVVVDTPDFVQKSADGNGMWQYNCLQLCGAKTSETSATTRAELGYALSSDSGKLLFANYSSGYLSGYTADTTGKDFAIVSENGVTTYEVAMPAAAFGADSLNKGDKIRLDITIVLSEDGSKPAVIEWAQGCYVAKDVTKFATVTLGDKIEVKKEAPASAAQTPDMIGLCLAALAASAGAAYAFGKRK